MKRSRLSKRKVKWYMWDDGIRRRKKPPVPEPATTLWEGLT
jgi:hypothetical protein